MLQIFRSNQPLLFLVLILYALVLRGNGFQLLLIEENSGFLSTLFFNFLPNTPILHSILALTFVLGQALFLNSIVNKYKLLRTLSYVPAMAYVLLSSCSLDLTSLSPQLISNSFLLIVLNELFNVYRKSKCMGSIFNVGFWIAIASLFYFSTAAFFFWGLIGIMSLRSYDIRELIVMISGFLVPYILIGVYFFWMDEFGLFFTEQVSSNFAFFSFQITLNLLAYIAFGMYSMVIIWSLINNSVFFNKASIQVQKYNGLLFWMLAISLLTLLCQQNISINHILLVLIPLSVMLAGNLLTIKHKGLAEVVHLLLFLGAIFNQYHNFFSVAS